MRRSPSQTAGPVPGVRRCEVVGGVCVLVSWCPGVLVGLVLVGLVVVLRLLLRLLLLLVGFVVVGGCLCVFVRCWWVFVGFGVGFGVVVGGLALRLWVWCCVWCCVWWGGVGFVVVCGGFGRWSSRTNRSTPNPKNIIRVLYKLARF